MDISLRIFVLTNVLLISNALISNSLPLKPCKANSSCSCVNVDGFYDLHPIANDNNTARFANVSDGQGNSIFSYNPCYGFDEGLSACKNAAICQKDLTTGENYVLGYADSMVSVADSEYGLIFQYSAKTDKERKAEIILECDPSTDGMLKYQDKDFDNIYYFRLYSKYACAQKPAFSGSTPPHISSRHHSGRTKQYQSTRHGDHSRLTPPGPSHRPPTGPSHRPSGHPFRPPTGPSHRPPTGASHQPHTGPSYRPSGHPSRPPTGPSHRPPTGPSHRPPTGPSHRPPTDPSHRPSGHHHRPTPPCHHHRPTPPGHHHRSTPAKRLEIFGLPADFFMLLCILVVLTIVCGLLIFGMCYISALFKPAPETRNKKAKSETSINSKYSKNNEKEALQNYF